MRPIFLSLSLIFLIFPLSTHSQDPLVDVTQSAGLKFKHVSGVETGNRYLVETMGGGGGWLDYDGDGWFDIYLVQSHSNVNAAKSPGQQHNVLYRNRGDGTFEDVSIPAGVADRNYGSGLAVGDIDNDGDTDLYVTNFGQNTLYLNQGDGTFKNITQASGIGSSKWSTAASFADFDSDGILDLYLVNYLKYETNPKFICKGNRLKSPDYCHPNRFPGENDQIFKGNGQGQFLDVTKAAGIGHADMFAGKGLGILPTDIDDDGDVDLLIANDSVPNQVWRNDGNFKFQDVGLEMGIALNPDGKALAGMGVDGGDVNGDGLIDYTITNFSKESNTLFMKHKAGFFMESGAIRGIAGPTFLPLGFGTGFFDLELDGDLDIYVACGHVSALIEKLYPRSGEVRLQPDMLFLNDGKGKFKESSKQSGAWFKRKLLGRAMAFADYDNDGDRDILVSNIEGPAVLLKNQASKGNHWVGFKLEGDGKKVNRDAYGSKVVVTSKSGKKQIFECRTASSYLSAHDPRIVCGLGKETQIQQVEIRWPDKKVEVFKDLKIDQYHVLKYGSSNS